MLEGDEKPLLCFKEDDLNWLLLTNARIIKEQAGVKFSMPFSELAEATPALQEEFKDKILNKEDFTRLALRDLKGNRHIIKLERGGPYQGVYQVLHHLASKSQSPQ